MNTNYPQVTQLAEAIKKYNIRFKVLPKAQHLAEAFYRKIEINISGTVFFIPVMDEYDDADSKNPTVLLHLVLQECEFYEKAQDFLVWTKDVGLDASSEIPRQIHLDLGQVVPHIHEKLPHIKAIPAYDIEFNTDVAQALRKITKRS